MSLDYGRSRQYAFLFVAIFALIYLCILCRGIYGAVGVHRIKSLLSAYEDYKSGAESQGQPSHEHDSAIDREEFIAISANSPLQEFDPSAIQAKCARRPWPSDILFQCHMISGGIGNVRQEILACMRWAMEQGSALVIPGIYRRKATNTSEGVRHEYEPDPIPLDYLFDREEFIATMHEACPQMVLYDSFADVPLRELAVSAGFVPTSLLKNSTWISANRKPVGNITVVEFPATIIEYEVCEDGAEFADAFGKLLPFRRDVYRLAATVLYELSQRFDLDIDPGTPITQNAFLGIHLRTSKDAQAYGWLDYSTQASLYVRLAQNRPLPAIYVASGNLTSIDLFATQLAEVSPAAVVTKHTLLAGDDLAALESLTWDQQGLVDYLVLLKSSQFLGMCHSSFTWGIVAGRRAILRNGTCDRPLARQGVRREVHEVQLSESSSAESGGGPEEDADEQSPEPGDSEAEDLLAWEENRPDINYKDELSTVVGPACIPDFVRLLWP